MKEDKNTAWGLEDLHVKLKTSAAQSEQKNENPLDLSMLNVKKSVNLQYETVSSSSLRIQERLVSKLVVGVLSPVNH